MSEIPTFGSMSVAVGYAQRLLAEQPEVRAVAFVPDGMDTSKLTDTMTIFRVADLVEGNWYVLERRKHPVKRKP